MKVEWAKQKVKCDASGCNNLCDYVIVNKKFVFDGSVYLCEGCMKSLYSEIGKFFIPKNIKPLYKKGGKNE
mgnify:CR=1 FL=1